MNLILLSGNSVRNKDWIHEADLAIQALFTDTFVQNYKHWESGQPNIDLEAELAALRTTVAAIEQPYGIFAKSIGMVLSTQAIEKGIIKPAFLLYMGAPLGYIETSYPTFARVLANAQLPLVIMHNEHDPVGSSSAVQAYLSNTLTDSLPGYTYIETVGSTHDYQDYTLLSGQLDKLIKLTTKKV